VTSSYRNQRNPFQSPKLEAVARQAVEIPHSLALKLVARIPIGTSQIQQKLVFQEITKKGQLLKAVLRLEQLGQLTQVYQVLTSLVRRHPNCAALSQGGRSFRPPTAQRSNRLPVSDSRSLRAFAVSLVAAATAGSPSSVKGGDRKLKAVTKDLAARRTMKGWDFD
jgi:hypothetical protein